MKFSKMIFAFLLLLVAFVSPAQGSYQYVVEDATVNEFDVMGNDKEETALHVEGSMNGLLPIAVGSSVTADSIGPVNFRASNCTDGNMRTAWMTSNNGKNEQIEFIIDLQDEKKIRPATLTKIAFFNGWRKDPQTWTDYARIKRIMLTVNDQPYAEITLDDTYKEQYISIDRLRIDRSKRYKFRFTILETYPGEKQVQAGLSDVQFIGKVR